MSYPARRRRRRQVVGPPYGTGLLDSAHDDTGPHEDAALGLLLVLGRPRVGPVVLNLLRRVQHVLRPAAFRRVWVDVALRSRSME